MYKYESDFKLLAAPFDVSVDAAELVRMELVDLQCNCLFMCKFYDSNDDIFTFYQNYHPGQHFPELRKHCGKLCLAVHSQVSDYSQK